MNKERKTSRHGCRLVGRKNQFDSDSRSVYGVFSSDNFPAFDQAAGGLGDVEVEIIGLPGDEYHTQSGAKCTVSNENVRVRIGRKRASGTADLSDFWSEVKRLRDETQS